jgi:tetratricopeptide (TPR) repeat protein
MKVFAVSLLVCVCALAQDHHHAPDAETAVDLAKVPKPVSLEGIGHSHITITTKSPEAQRWFDQGLALLHCFWDYEALRAFAEALRLDPDCAMCHWGAARALTSRGGNEDQAKAELAHAKDLSGKASDREQRYIRADSESKEQKGDEAGRAFAKEMEALIERYPDDVEARLLYALQLNHGYDEKGDPRLGTIYGQAALRELLRQYPDNAAANHYWIHAVEGSAHPEWAVASAEKLGMLAPASGHMVHMPGHIFYRIGDYERARQIFLAAMRVDQDYMTNQHVAVRDDWNYAHNISYLIADCAEEGRYAEALEHARSLAGLANDPDRTESPGFYVLQIGSTEARLAIRYGRWEDAIGRPMSFGVPDDKLNVWARGYRNGIVAYARGMLAVEADKPAEAEEQSNALDALLWRLSQEDLSDKLDDKNKGPRDRVLKLLGTASLELRGDIAGHRGDFETARSLLARADEAETKLGYSEPPQYSRPALEVLGALCTRAGKFDEARTAFGTALARRPHSGFALYGIAAAWEKEGKRSEAAKAYREFLEAWSHADRDLPQIRAAQESLAAAESGARLSSQ